jgi:hypothetical protein
METIFNEKETKIRNRQFLGRRNIPAVQESPKVKAQDAKIGLSK